MVDIKLKKLKGKRANIIITDEIINMNESYAGKIYISPEILEDIKKWAKPLTDEEYDKLYKAYNKNCEENRKSS